MEFPERNIYNIIASYIPVSNAKECILTEKQAYFAENINCSNGEFTVFSFCKLYNLDTNIIDGDMFGYHIQKIAIFFSESHNLLKKLLHCSPNIIQTILDFLLKINTNCPNININIALLLEKINNANIEMETNMLNLDNLNLTQQLYQKIIKFDTKLNTSDFKLYDIYANYYMLNFVDVNTRSQFLFNKYITQDYFNQINGYSIKNIPPHAIYGNSHLLKNNIQYKKFIKTGNQLTEFCKEFNPFYAFIEDTPTLIVRERDFNLKLEKYTNNLCSKFILNQDGVWPNFIIAGGCVFNCLNNYTEQDQTVLQDGDIDIFFYGQKKDQKKAFNYVLDIIKQDNIIIEIIQLSYNSIEIISQNLRRTQLILTEHNTPEEIIQCFDLWASSVFYNGRQVLGNLNFLYSIKFWHEKINNRELNPKSMLRISKYMKKGMRLYVSEPTKYELFKIDKTNLTMNEYIEKIIKEKYGDVLHNKHRTIMRDGFIETWFSEFIILKPNKLSKYCENIINIDNSCQSIHSAIQSLCETLEQLFLSENDMRHLNMIERFYKNCHKHISHYSDGLNNTKAIQEDIEFYHISHNNKLNINCVLDTNFNNFNYLFYILNIYKDALDRVSIKLFLDGDFTFDDKEIIVSNYNIQQASVLNLLLNYIKENN